MKLSDDVMMNRAREIVFTGGPCSGKTSALSYIPEKLNNFGWRVFTVPEVATMFIRDGIPDIKEIYRNDLDLALKIQETILLTQMALRDRYVKLSQVFKKDRKVIIYDRGPMDIMAYIREKDFWRMVKRLGYKARDMRDSFDAVIHLVTTADGAESFYTTANNKARKENLSEARKSDKATCNAWNGHPHLRVINNSTDFDGKLNRIFQSVSRVLGIPVPLEIERKFLLKEVPDFTNLAFGNVQQVYIEQRYLLNPDKDGHLRIRKRSQKGSSTYYKTHKVKIRPGVRHEAESHITAAEYLSLQQFQDPDRRVIEKYRYCFVYQSQYFELDVFIEPVQICLLEIELTEENDKVELPPFIKVEKEVTDDPQYSNSEIAKL